MNQNPVSGSGDSWYGTAHSHMAKLFPQRGRLYSLGAVPRSATLQLYLGSQNWSREDADKTRLDTMGLDPAGFTSIDLVYDFLRLLFLTKDGLATYIWVLCNHVQPLCAAMAVSFCCSPNVTSSPITFPFQAQVYALEGVIHLSSNLWQDRVHPYQRTPDANLAKHHPSSEGQNRAQRISKYHSFSLQPYLNHISIQPLHIIPGGLCSSKKSFMGIKEAHTDHLCILSSCGK